MTGVLSLDELTDSSSNDSGSTDSDNSGSDSDSLREACEAIGADYERAQEYVDEHGNKSDLIDFAQRLANDDELFDAMAAYRQGNCVNRIIQKYLRPHAKDFTTFTGAFYGNSDDPAEGTYNFVQQQARSMDGNLYWYQALFPEPVAERWDSPPVLWHQFDDIGFGSDQQDTHIYVTKDFVQEYDGFTLEVDGHEKPRPPANDELGSGGASAGNSGSGDLLIDPADFTVEELRDKLQQLMEQGASAEQLHALEDAEADDKDRKTAKLAIRGAANQREDEESSESGDQQELSDAAKAGEVNAGQANIPPEKVIELMDKGFTKEEIIELYG